MKQWNQCDYCGRFIGLNEFQDGTAVRNLITPDTWITAEKYVTHHKVCEQSALTRQAKR